MAIFGMNGLQALALDFLLIFAVYGMKEVALTTNQVATVGRVVARKSMKNDKEQNAGIARAAREQVLRSMALKSGRYTTTQAQQEAFTAKTWLR